MNLECFTDPVRESPVPAGGLQMWLICYRNQTFLLALTSSDDVLMHNQRCISIVEYAKNLIALSLSTFLHVNIHTKKASRNPQVKLRLDPKMRGIWHEVFSRSTNKVCRCWLALAVDTR